MTNVHGRLKVICAWCDGKERVFRKAVDLKDHIKTAHKTILREPPPDSFGEPGCFWLSKFPQDYKRLVKPLTRDSPEGRFLRHAVEKWWLTLGKDSSKTLMEWKSGWSLLPLVSPSPSPALDYEESPLLPCLHDLTISKDEVAATFYEENQTLITWYKAVLSPRILTVQKQWDSFMRRFQQTKPYRGEVPAIFSHQLTENKLKAAKIWITGKLVVDAEYIDSVFKLEMRTFPAKSDTDQEPAQKKRKVVSLETALCRSATAKKTGPTYPLDVIMPLMGSNTNTSSTPEKEARGTPTDKLKRVSPPVVPTITATGQDPSATVTKSPEELDPSATVAKSPEKLESPITVMLEPTMVSPVASDANPPKTSSAPETGRKDHLEVTSTDVDCNSAPASTTTCRVSTPRDGQEATTQSELFIGSKGPLFIPVSPEMPKMLDNDARHSTDIDAAGDRHISQYVPADTTPDVSYPVYSPTPRDQPQRVSMGALEMRAEAIMKTGCMPLLAPARRSWEQEESIVLPASSPVPKWPPRGWTSFSPDAKLLVWETVSTSLAIKDGLQLDRGEILDSFNFLALPGSKDPVIRTKLQNARYHNYMALRDVRLSRSQTTELVEMFEAAKSCHKPSISTSVLLEQIERKKNKN